MPRQRAPVDQFAIATFSAGKVQIDVPFTSDREACDEAVRSWEGFGTTALHDAVAWLPTITADRNGDQARRGADHRRARQRLDARRHPGARAGATGAELPVYVFGFETGDVYTLDAAGKKVYRYSDMLNLAGQPVGRAVLSDPGSRRPEGSDASTSSRTFAISMFWDSPWPMTAAAARTASRCG